MAKFKKKKSAPTPGNDDSKPKIEENIDTPEIEKSPPATNNSKEPSKDPPINAAEKSEKDKKLAKLFWMRIALGVIAGIATTFIFEDIEGDEENVLMNIPPEILERMGWGPGDTLNISVEDGVISISKKD